MKGIENSKIPRLFELMNEKGIKGKDITRDLHISSGNISDWKSGKSSPASGVITTLANYLGTTPDYLLGKTDKKEKPTVSGEPSQNADELFSLCQSLPPEKRQQALDYLRYLSSQNKEN